MEALSPNCNDRMTSWGINGNILSLQRPPPPPPPPPPPCQDRTLGLIRGRHINHSEGEGWWRTVQPVGWGHLHKTQVEKRQGDGDSRPGPLTVLPSSCSHHFLVIYQIWPLLTLLLLPFLRNISILKGLWYHRNDAVLRLACSPSFPGSLIWLHPMAMGVPARTIQHETPYVGFFQLLHHFWGTQAESAGPQEVKAELPPPPSRWGWGSVWEHRGRSCPWPSPPSFVSQLPLEPLQSPRAEMPPSVCRTRAQEKLWNPGLLSGVRGTSLL